MNDDPRATLIQPTTVRFERLLPGPIERVWTYLTVSEKRATWLAAGEFDLRVGGAIELRFDNDSLSDDTPKGGPSRSIKGRITRLDPPRLLAHTWQWDAGDSEVTYELAPQGKDVLLTIHHRMPDARGLILAVGGGWPVHAGILADVLNGVKPRPFWSTHARVAREFEAAN